jgi:hypothetical protein
MLEEHCFMVSRRQPREEVPQKISRKNDSALPTANNLAEEYIALSLSFLYPLKQSLSKFVFIKYLQHTRFAVQFHPKYDDTTEK